MTVETILITGTMKGGKSEELILRIRDAYMDSDKVLVVKPVLDTRDGHFVKSRATVEQFLAYPLDEKNEHTVHNLLYGIKYYHHVFIDEAQFISLPLMRAIEAECLENGVSLTVSGIMHDFINREFPSISWLYDMADQVLWLQANCDKCDGFQNAQRNVRVQDGIVQQVGEAIAVEGANVEYLTVCNKCFKKMIGK